MTTDDLALVALSPADLAPTQAALGGWCSEKVAALQREQADLEEHLLIASANGWKLAGLNSALNRVARRVTSYEKNQGGRRGGVSGCAELPGDDAGGPRETRDTAARDERLQVRPFRREGAVAPGGRRALRGRHADPPGRELHRREGREEGTQDAAGRGLVRRTGLSVHAGEAAVLDATQRAMAFKVFDEIGVVMNRSGDPIMVGRILDPRGNGRCVTMFLAWWLSTGTAYELSDEKYPGHPGTIWLVRRIGLERMAPDQRRCRATGGLASFGNSRRGPMVLAVRASLLQVSETRVSARSCCWRSLGRSHRASRRVSRDGNPANNAKDNLPVGHRERERGGPHATWPNEYSLHRPAG